MSEYRTLFGKAVKALASDPTDAGAEGQIWYNTTTGSFRTVLATAAWSAGGDLSTARRLSGGAGIQTSALAIGGNPNIAATESYDGTSWTAVSDLATGRNNIAGTGSSNTSALAFGGNIPPKTAATEEFSFAPATRTFTTS